MFYIQGYEKNGILKFMFYKYIKDNEIKKIIKVTIQQIQIGLMNYVDCIKNAQMRFSHIMNNSIIINLLIGNHLFIHLLFIMAIMLID